MRNALLAMVSLGFLAATAGCTSDPAHALHTQQTWDRIADDASRYVGLHREW